MFFKPLVDSLMIGGHDVFCTSRDYREAIELARIKNLEIKIVGKHGGEDRYNKLRGQKSRPINYVSSLLLSNYLPSTSSLN